MTFAVSLMIEVSKLLMDRLGARLKPTLLCAEQPRHGFT